MAEIGAGEIQTLISTLQNSNKQSGHIIQAIQGLGVPLASAGTAAARAAASAAAAAATAAANTSSALRISAPNGSGSALAARTGGAGLSAPLPDAPEGYITVDIPGVGPRLIPYYPA
jgi:hypothetical protein